MAGNNLFLHVFLIRRAINRPARNFVSELNTSASSLDAGSDQLEQSPCPLASLRGCHSHDPDTALAEATVASEVRHATMVENPPCAWSLEQDAAFDERKDMEAASERVRRQPGCNSRTRLVLERTVLDIGRRGYGSGVSGAAFGRDAPGTRDPCRDPIRADPAAGASQAYNCGNRAGSSSGYANRADASSAYGNHR